MVTKLHIPVAKARKVAAAAAVSTVLVAVIASAPALAKGRNASTAPGCSISAPTAPSWLTVSGWGLTSGSLYQIAVATPAGTVLGDTFYPTSDGNFVDTNLPASAAGAYSVSVTKYKGNTPLATCSTVVS